jgi:hypothetical protein
MEPPTKKSKNGSSLSDDDGSTSDDLLKSEKILGELATSLKIVDPSSMGNLSTELLCKFLELKALQRVVLGKLSATQTIIEEQYKQRDQEEQKLENLKYQELVNNHSINVCNEFEKTQLLKLCCDEIGIPVPETEDEIKAALQKVLGSDLTDPKNRASVAAKLNKEVSTRAALGAELKVAQHKVATLKKNLASKRKLVKELPLKLQEMEMASKPLQKFCQKSLNASQKLGLARQTALELARSLPKPLYTLYHQLQSCLDVIKSKGKSESDLLPSLEISKNSVTIVLKIQIPNISDTSSTVSRMKRFVNVSFEYANQWDMVTAYASTEHGMEDLIEELFPGDTGEWTENEAEDDVNSDRRKRPYNWCNYLAGLHLVPESKNASEMHLSTRVVVRALIRRVRSKATLHFILQMLSRKPNPISVHASMKNTYISDPVSTARLTEWRLENAGSRGSFIATMTHGSSTIAIRVTVNSSRYPAVPPEIRLSNTTMNAHGLFSTKTGSSNELGNDSELYDDRLAMLERKVNQQVDELVVSGDDTTYEWILAHQLAEIAKAFGGF